MLRSDCNQMEKLNKLKKVFIYSFLNTVIVAATAVMEQKKNKQFNNLINSGGATIARIVAINKRNIFKILENGFFS